MAAAVIAQVGCSDSAPLARVSGNIVFEGAPVAEGIILFSNPDQGVHITAKIRDGAYEVVTSHGKGLIPGMYAVAITPPVDEHAFGPLPEPPKSGQYPDIPQRYRSVHQSGLSVQLENGENQADFVMTKS